MFLRPVALLAIAASAASCLLDTHGLTDGGADSCPGKGAPKGVRIGSGEASFCIDATEVTNRQYAAFLQEAGEAPRGLPATCDFKATHLPPSPGWPAAADRQGEPVASVDWCDALAYCRWAGKELCGRPLGGAHAPAAMNDSRESAWYMACSKNGERTYPYGATYDRAACVGEGISKVGAAGALASCEGAYPGLFDMSGNVEEWTDSCEADSAGPAAANDGCLARGGNFDDVSQGRLGCASSSGALESRGSGEPWRGFRCCAR